MQTKYAASPQITLWASAESVLVFFNMKYKPKSLPSLSLPVQLRRSWSAWTRRGLWCAGRVSACQTWTVTKSLGGSPAAAWQESWSSPAHRRSERSPHTNRLSCSSESFKERGDWMRGWWGYHRGRKRSSDGIVRDTASYGDEDTKLSMDWAEKSDVGKASDHKRLRTKPDGEKHKEQRKRFSRRETISHWREDSCKRSKTL